MIGWSGIVDFVYRTRIVTRIGHLIAEHQVKKKTETRTLGGVDL